MKQHHPNVQIIALTRVRGKPTTKQIRTTSHHIDRAADLVVEDENATHRNTNTNLEQEALEALGLVDILLLPQVDIDDNYDDTAPLTLVSDPFWCAFNEWRHNNPDDYQQWLEDRQVDAQQPNATDQQDANQDEETTTSTSSSATTTSESSSTSTYSYPYWVDSDPDPPSSYWESQQSSDTTFYTPRSSLTDSSVYFTPPSTLTCPDIHESPPSLRTFCELFDVSPVHRKLLLPGVRGESRTRVQRRYLHSM